MQLLARDGIGLPVTTFAHDPKQTEEVLKLAGGAPLVIKLLEGTQGIGVVLADTDRSAKSVIEAFRGAASTSWCRSSSRKPAAPTSARWWSAAR
jgi:ribosomal protein S6--L-glutamate ligase